MGKYYISADLEGIYSVSSWHQCYPKTDRSGYVHALDQMTLEINTVAEALKQADDQAMVVVNDAHSMMTNLQQDKLLPWIQLISGKPKICAMMAGLDNSFDAVILLGYHAKAGTLSGVLNHSFHDKIFDITINTVSYGEGGINSLFASLVHEVPLMLASGDQAFCEEIQSLLPSLQTIATKTGLSTTAAHHVDQAGLLLAYQERIAKLLGKPGMWHNNQLQLKGPYTLRITFVNTLACDIVMTSPWYTRVDGRTVEVKTTDFKTLYQALQSAYTSLAYATHLEP